VCWVFLRYGLVFCPSWPQTTILLLSASQAVRITYMGYCCLAKLTLKKSIWMYATIFIEPYNIYNAQPFLKRSL
jgi:uncharacterized membrane protein YobD (UPF0266 family)